MDNNAIIQDRKPVWIALSTFHLDTELEDDDLKQILKVFNNSSYNLNEIKLIDRYEVWPVVGSNCFSPAGEWAGFDEVWLVKWASKRINKRWSCNFISSFFHKYFTKRYWNKINILIN